MSKLVIDLTFNPVGGALSQIKEIINNIDLYIFDEILFYSTRENNHLFQDVNTNKIKVIFVPFSNKSIILRSFWAQFILPFHLLIDKSNILFCPGNISPILNFTKKAQWIGTVGPFEKNFIYFFGLKQRIILFINKYLMILSSYTSDLVIFESQYTKNLFVKKWIFRLRFSVFISDNNNIGCKQDFTPCTGRKEQLHF